MRRFRPIRRRRARESELPPQAEADPHVPAGDVLTPFVPVRPAVLEDESVQAAGWSREHEQQPRLRRRGGRAPLAHVRPSLLLLALALVAVGIVGTLVNLDRLELSVPDAWPAGVLLVAVVWLIVSLARRQVTPALGAATLAGIGLSALLDAEAIAPWRETLVGLVLIAVGLGIVIRGLLLRQRVLA